MGKTICWMSVSLDLRIEQADGENGGGEWLRIDDEIHKVFNTRASQLALMVQGRKIYEIMEQFWPQAATDTNLSPVMRGYGKIWTFSPKVLVSNSRKEAG